MSATDETAELEGACCRVVIAGGGVAGLEALIALRDLAGDRIEVSLLCPAEEFVYRPMTVLEPFAYPRAYRYPLAPIAAEFGAELERDALDWVDPRARIAHTVAGEQLVYDALLVAVGAQLRAAHEHVLTVEPDRIDTLLHGLIQDIEGGYSRRIAFLAGPHLGWPLPLYELALMTAARAYEMQIAIEITLVTPEDSPLAIFGQAASTAVSELLRDAGISTVTSAYAEVPRQGVVTIKPAARQLEADRIVAMPMLMGPSLRGIPTGEDGFT